MERSERPLLVFSKMPRKQGCWACLSSLAAPDAKKEYALLVKADTLHSIKILGFCYSLMAEWTAGYATYPVKDPSL